MMEIEEFRLAERKVFFSKHLCGAATDYAINSCVRCCQESQAKNEKAEYYLVIALCCHHLCKFESFDSKFLQNYNVDAGEFKSICTLSSWATCKFNRTQDNRRGKIYFSDNNLLLVL